MVREDDEIPTYAPGSRPSDDQPCSHRLGYIRQDVYACLHCAKRGADGRAVLSGFCVGCKSSCHSGPQCSVIDLYSKRFFRCDCGNSRMKNTCHLDNTKNPENTENAKVYNHNFIGTYCRCDRPYDAKWGDMLQCAVCEDWFHEVCLVTTDDEPASKTSAKLSGIACELVCCDCSNKIPLLDDYFARIGLFQPPTPLTPAEVQTARAEGCERPPDIDHSLLRGKDRLWQSGFRLRLCRCEACKDEYAKLGVSYLIDRKDFVNLQGIDDEDLLVNAPNDEAMKRDIEKKAKKKKSSSSSSSSKKKKKRSSSSSIRMPAQVIALDDDENVDLDDDENENDTTYIPRVNGDHSATGSSSRRKKILKKRVREPLPVVELTNSEREYIRKSITSFINKAIGSDPVPDEKQLKTYLENLREDILTGQY